MKLLKRILAVVMICIMAFSCFGLCASAATVTVSSISIKTLPNKTNFFKYDDWRYGYYLMPDYGTDKGVFVAKDGVICFNHNGGFYSQYSDVGMLDMTGLVLTVTFSDGSKADITYKETLKTGNYYYQNILVSPASNYKVGSCKVEVYFAEKPSVYNTYTINIINYRQGDINKDNSVNSSDALLALQSVVKLKTLTSEQKTLADMNSDSKITSSDALLILRKSISM